MTVTNLTELEWLALCVYDEARGQCFAGQRAVARVVLNRARRKYASDGTIKGTVLKPNQFSGFYFDMVNGKYTRTCGTQKEAEAKGLKKWTEAAKHPVTLKEAMSAAVIELGIEDFQIKPGMAIAAPLELGLVVPINTVLYVNLAVVKRPVWADPKKQVAVIQDHTFFSA